MFKRLFMLTLLSAVFLSGYYLGRQPGSPDVIGMAQSGYAKAAELGKTIEAVSEGEGFEALEALGMGRGASGERARAESRTEVTGDLRVD